MVTFLKNRTAYPDELEVWQVAKILKCSTQNVYQLLRDKHLAHYHIGKKYFIDANDLARFLEQRRVEAIGDSGAIGDSN